MTASLEQLTDFAESCKAGMFPGDIMTDDPFDPDAPMVPPPHMEAELDAELPKPVITPRTKKTTATMGQLVDTALGQLKERNAHGSGLLGITSGWAAVDKHLDGLQPGRMYVVGARTGVGKSVFALMVALNAAQAGHPVMYFTLEMPSIEHVLRALFRWAGVNHNRAKNHTLHPADWDALGLAAEQMRNLPITWDEGTGLSIAEITRRVGIVKEKSVAKGRPLALVIVDHAGLVAGHTDRCPRREQMIRITGGLKDLAKTSNVAVMALVQLNRQLENRTVKDKRPQISDLKE